LTILGHGDQLPHQYKSRYTRQEQRNRLIPNLGFNKQSHALKFHFRDNVCNISIFQNTNCITASLLFHIAFRLHFL